MQTKEYCTVDKAAWPLRGAWDDEPDKKQWQDTDTGLPCLAHRGPGGYWCGYVGVPPRHPWHGIDYSSCTLPAAKPRGPKDGDEKLPEWLQKQAAARLVCADDWCRHTPEALLDAHGGITFSEACADTADESVGICHLPDPGEPKNVWWFGFDCGHFGDLAPARDRSWSFGEAQFYRDLAYVERECASLARRLAGIRQAAE